MSSQLFTLKPSALPYTGPTPPPASVIGTYLNVINETSYTWNWTEHKYNTTGVSAVPVQFVGQNHNWTWGYDGIDSNGNKATQILVIDSDGKIMYATATTNIDLITDATSQIVTSAVKNYYTFDVNYELDSIDQIVSQSLVLTSKYDLNFSASNIVAVPISNSGSNSTGVNVLNSVGAPLYTFSYIYAMVKYTLTLDSAGAVVATAQPSVTLSSSNAKAATYNPFENYIMDGESNLINFDLFYNYNTLNSLPVIKTISKSQTYYLAYVMDPVTKVVTLKNIPYYDIDSAGHIIPGTGQVLDSAGNRTDTLDSAGNIIPGSIPNGVYITSAYGNISLNYQQLDSFGNQVLDSAGNPVIDVVSCSIAYYEFADVVIDSLGNVHFDGPVIVQIVNILEVIEDSTVDTCCNQINEMISSINTSTYNFGTFSNYQELITEVNDYTSNLDAAKITLNVEQVNYLEQYASNVQQMSNLFGQLVIQLNSTSLVDSEAICLRIKSALTTIADGLQNLKAFKLAIGQQNLLRISECLLTMSGKIEALFKGLNAPNNSEVGVNVYDGTTKPSPLFLLNESIWYFASGLPTNDVTKGGAPNNVITHLGTNYYRTYTNASTYVLESFYHKYFDLSADDSADLIAAKALIHNLNNNMSNNVQLVNSNPDIIKLGSALGQFQGLSTSLTNAQMNLMLKLGALGIQLKMM